MVAPRNRKHILVPFKPVSESYSPHPRAPFSKYPGPRDRIKHAKRLLDTINEIQTVAQDDKYPELSCGIQIEFESPPGFDLRLQSLDIKKLGIELLNVRSKMSDDDQKIQLATVFIPDGALSHFIGRFLEYAKGENSEGKIPHKDLVDRISDLRKASLEALWTEVGEPFPEEDKSIWWEVWLRRHDGNELRRLDEFASKSDFIVGERRLCFGDRIVVLAKATSVQLSASLEVLCDVAELRHAKESVAFFLDHLTPQEQADWAIDFLKRVIPPEDNAPVICILDTGVTNGHPLLQKFFNQGDVTSVDPAWGAHDHDGHGTNMAGLAAYGDLAQALSSSEQVSVLHRLESVKILPRANNNEPDLYGAITAQAVALPETHAPNRQRVFSMSVTATDQRDRGRPTSWSAAIDALAAGRSFDPAKSGLVYLDNTEDNMPRLFILSSGNVEPNFLSQDYFSRCELEPIHDPAHAWNALTVGAYTEKELIGAGIKFSGWSPLARPGDLSPWSTTSVTFEKNRWPLKPDVVCEGGNIGTNGVDIDFPIPDLSLLTTHYKPIERVFTLSHGTSAATAQASRIAAIIAAKYPNLWPETVRGLIVQSAEWTNAMKARFGGRSSTKKRDREDRVKRYGYGVPNITRAIRSANDSLTLIVQESISPFKKRAMREMHIHNLPWPKTVLEEMGAAKVCMRVTLSYFIEPNPGSRGWKDRYHYASHGLRFDVKQPTESEQEFRKRINHKAIASDEDRPVPGDTYKKWLIGEKRNKGSLHSDIWQGTAAELAECGVIGVYPVSGWWKHQQSRDRSEVGARYALIVSIESSAEDIDIWTPVAVKVGVPVEVVEEMEVNL